MSLGMIIVIKIKLRTNVWLKSRKVLTICKANSFRGLFFLSMFLTFLLSLLVFGFLISPRFMVHYVSVAGFMFDKDCMYCTSAGTDFDWVSDFSYLQYNTVAPLEIT